MGLTDQDLASLAPSAPPPPTSGKSPEVNTGYAWALFYVIIISFILFFVLYAFGAMSTGSSSGKPGKRPKIDQTAYGWNLLLAVVAAVVVVAAVAYYRRRK